MHPLEGSTYLDLNLCLAHKLIKLKRSVEYYLKIRSNVGNHIVLPNLKCSDVLNEGKWLYPYMLFGS